MYLTSESQIKLKRRKNRMVFTKPFIHGVCRTAKIIRLFFKSINLSFSLKQATSKFHSTVQISNLLLTHTVKIDTTTTRAQPWWTLNDWDLLHCIVLYSFYRIVSFCIVSYRIVLFHLVLVLTIYNHWIIQTGATSRIA